MRYGLAVTVVAMWPALATAQQANLAALSTKDLQVANTIHQMNQTEVGFARFAKDHASSREVQAFADRLIKDHDTANEKLRSLVENRGGKITEPDDKVLAQDPDAQKAMAKIDGLKPLKDATFDSAFTALMVKEHEAALRKVRDLEKQASDSTIRATLTGMVPAIQEHLKIARDLSGRTTPRKPSQEDR